MLTKGEVTSTDIGIKSYQELNEIGRKTNNSHLLWACLMSEIYTKFWFRKYTEVLQLCVNFPTAKHKRLDHVFRCFFEGIAALNIARQSHESKWRVIGEKAVEQLSSYELLNKWSFQNKHQLLQAELHYLNSDLKLAEQSYEASIKSAQDHKFIHDEALAFELLGMFYIENGLVDKGVEQLRIALSKYEKWGSLHKAVDLQQCIDRLLV